MTTPNAGNARRTWWRQFGQLYAVALLFTIVVALLSGFAASRFSADDGYPDDFFGDPLLGPSASSANELLNSAEQALLQNQLDDAILAAEEALAIDPFSEPAVAIKANSHFEKFWATQSESEREAGRAMLDLLQSPRGAQAYAAHGNLAFINGDLEAAVTALQQAVAAEPVNAYAQHQLGYMLDAAGRTEESLVHFQQALELAPTMAWVQDNLGSALARLSRCDQYVPGLQPVIVAACQNQMGIASFDSGDYPAARHRFQQAVDLAPESGIFHVNLAGALFKLGANGDAMTHAQQARGLGIRENWVFGELGIQ